MRSVLLLLLTAAATTAEAQLLNGKIVYESTFTFNSGTTDSAAKASGLPAEILKMIPAGQKTKKILYYTADNSLYENDPAPAAEEHFEQGNMKVQFHSEAPEEKIFTDILNHKKVQQRDLMGRTFLVSGDINPAKWKMTGRQKLVLDMPCMEAMLAGEGDTVIAWYAPGIPVSTGPEGMGGLPGLILEAAIGKSVTVKALSVTVDATAASHIKLPVKGKKISEPAFRELAKAKQEELQKQYGSNEQVIFRVISK